MKYVLGIDDAGRGPIIGPMVLSGTIFKREDLPELKKLGVKDSKLIPPLKRRYLFDQIKDLAHSYKVIKISPNEIDTRGEKGLNLNDLEAIKMAEIVNELTKGLTDVHVVIDCPSTNTFAWKNYLLKHVKKLEGKKFIVEHKADFNYPACAAASIISKVERDGEIEKIKAKIKVDFGSGYPADPKTIKFIKERGLKYRNHGIIRKTWQTWKNLFSENDQKKLF